MISLITSIIVMGALTLIPFALGFWCGKTYQGLKNER
jgi:hypothetical protein